MCQLSMHHPYPATKPRTRPMKHSPIGTHPNGMRLTDRGVRRGDRGAAPVGRRPTLPGTPYHHAILILVPDERCRRQWAGGASQCQSTSELTCGCCCC
jgi:hypothetical protein